MKDNMSSNPLISKKNNPSGGSLVITNNNLIVNKYLHIIEIKNIQ